jgi:hypothetical protein
LRAHKKSDRHWAHVCHLGLTLKIADTAGVCGLTVLGKLSTNISRINERWQATIRGWFSGKTTNSVRTRKNRFRVLNFTSKA